MIDQEVAYDPNSDLWTFELTDREGTVFMIQVHSESVIELVQQIKREADRITNPNRPALRLIKGLG